MPPENYYKTLNISEKASSEEIKKAFRQMSLKYHPDKNPGRPEVVDMFHKINEAYETLSDDTKRKIYDLTGMSSNEQQNHET